MGHLDFSDETGLVIPQHLLLIGQTKAGKSRYIVEAVKDGYECIFVDADNSLSTIRDELKDNKEALARLHYFAPSNMEVFVVNLLNEGIFRWNETRNSVYSRANAAPTDRLAQIIPSKIPSRVILAIDSWTSLTYSILRNRAAALKVDLTEIDRYSREIYGGAGFQTTGIAQVIQSLRHHVIVLAHPASYEIKQKPKGIVGQINEKDMRILEVKQVPISTSLPHGLTIGKYFSQIGNMYVKDPTNQRVLDFKIDANRIGGGTPGGIGDPMKEYRYSKLFGLPKVDPEEYDGWIRYLTAEELAEETAAKAAGKPASKVIQRPQVVAGGLVTANKPTTESATAK